MKLVSARKAACILLAVAFVSACDPGAPAPPPSPPGSATAGGGELILYCGREQSLVGPIIDQFEKATGIDVKVKYGNTAQLAATLLTEKDKSPADVFWSQDVAALGQVTSAGMFATLPAPLQEKVPAKFRHADGSWIGTSGRARVLAYAPKRVKKEQLPASILDLANPKWAGRVGWAPRNGSFQAFLTAMRASLGNERTLKWLKAMKANGAKVYPKNTPIIEALAAGEIDLGIPNHYYLLRFKAERGEAFPVEQTFFQAGDLGNLFLAAGVGVIKTSSRSSVAHRFIEFLLTEQTAQQYDKERHFEFPTATGVKASPRLPGQDKLGELAPDVDLSALDDLEGTRKLLIEAGLL